MFEICEVLFWIFLYGYRWLVDDCIVSIIDLILVVNFYNYVYVEKEFGKEGDNMEVLFCLLCSRIVLLEIVLVFWLLDKIWILKKWICKL